MGQARVQTVGSGDIMIRTPQPMAEVARSQSTPTNWTSIAEGGGKNLDAEDLNRSAVARADER